MRYEPIITSRADQLNTARTCSPGSPFGEHTPSSIETPTAVQGFQNCWPLVMICTGSCRWRRKSELVTLAPWDWECRVWNNALSHRDDRGGPRIRVDGYVLPLDLSGDMAGQIRCLDEVDRLLLSLSRPQRAGAQAAPVAIVAMCTEPDGTLDAVPATYRTLVESRVAAVLSGPIRWYVQPEFRVQALGWGRPEPTEAMDITAPLNWMMCRGR